MSLTNPAFIAILLVLVIGAAGTALLRYVLRSRLEADAGIQALAAMRWREFSQFVCTALQNQGFDAAPLDDDGSSRDPTDLLLTRDNRSWLLTCRQSPEYRVTATQVEEMNKAVRLRGAAGGVIATLGQVERTKGSAPERVELIDGRALWDLIGPLLPAGLHEHLHAQVRRRERNMLIGVWIAALLIGIGAAALVGLQGDATPPVTEPAGGASPPAGAPATQPGVAAQTTAPVPAGNGATGAGATERQIDAADDPRERQQVLDAVDAIAGVDHAVWSSRSTLLVLLESATANPREEICAVVERYERLQASRIQLQPPPGSTDPVRFMQCKLY